MQIAHFESIIRALNITPQITFEKLSSEFSHFSRRGNFGKLLVRSSENFPLKSKTALNRTEGATCPLFRTRNFLVAFSVVREIFRSFTSSINHCILRDQVNCRKSRRAVFKLSRNSVPRDWLCKFWRIEKD